ncbi:molybdopterin molybdotransferase MoeA [Nannocystis sp. ILAH1]|uniref:molybdopterin molybdotransferase MoeA n=1 Tax=Nannocystis sp. ILAH1 TaxID=2996789 RepID=UPI00226DD702|nr:gephyrin-like molybdotransferase Glp [Nannocystis sp. ILAH1]MCY0991947.1 molybdopterin molybdotransferase MoeA [Nannocystis sp. ILAH1]
MTADDLELADALARVLSACAPLPGERRALPAARGRVLAEALHARWAMPGADVSTMDGWAVRAADLSPGTARFGADGRIDMSPGTVSAMSSGSAGAGGRATGRPAGDLSSGTAASPIATGRTDLSPRTAEVELAVLGESAAGHPSAAVVGSGQAMRISTGAVLPPGADAVVAQEDVRRQGERLWIDLGRAGEIRPGHFVRRAGSDLTAGVEILSPRTALRPGDLALAAGAGHADVLVHRPPRVAVLCTGDELVDIGCPPGHGQVVSSNGLMLALQAEAAGAEVRDLGRVGDEPEALRRALADAAASADVVLVSGGISVGDHDLVWPALLALGAEPIFRRVRLRPGRPLAFARLGDARVFALPGNPASTYVGFELFARPALRRLAGHLQVERPRRRVVLAAPAEGAGRRTHCVRARLVDGRAEPLPSQVSGALTSLRGCDLLVLVPPGPGLPAGAEADALVLADPGVE